MKRRQETNLILSRSDLCPAPLWDTIFGRPAPLEIEVGVGKGRFLCERAAAYPERNFIGVEKGRKWLIHAGTRLEKRGITNVRLVCDEAENFLEECRPDASVSIFHVYFPDPWPKRRHHKKRLFQNRFLRQVLRTLTTDGELHVATDHKGYFEVISSILRVYSRNGLIAEAAQPGPFLTNYQMKYLKEGRPLRFLRVRRYEAQPGPTASMASRR